MGVALAVAPLDLVVEELSRRLEAVELLAGIDFVPAARRQLLQLGALALLHDTGDVIEHAAHAARDALER